MIKFCSYFSWEAGGHPQHIPNLIVHLAGLNGLVVSEVAGWVLPSGQVGVGSTAYSKG